MVTRLSWRIYAGNALTYAAENDEGDLLGLLKWERVGQHMHWCWYQEEDIRMSPGCLQEVRDKQKELRNMMLDKR